MVVPKEERAQRLSVSLGAPLRGLFFYLFVGEVQGRTRIAASSSSCAHAAVCHARRLAPRAASLRGRLFATRAHEIN